MSLDVYLTMAGVRVSCSEPKIYIREEGQNKEISREEWNQRWPDREPYTLTSLDDDEQVYSRNITHNLNTMAEAAGIYLALWRPGEMLDPATSAKMKEQADAKNYHGPGGVFELERTLPVPHAGELIKPLETGLAKLKDQPSVYRAFNPSNGWGSYEGLVEFVENYLSACKQYPDAEVSVWR